MHNLRHGRSDAAIEAGDYSRRPNVPSSAPLTVQSTPRGEKRASPLEDQFQAELDLPRKLLRREPADGSEDAGPCVEVPIGLPEVHVVERVEQFGAELQSEALREPEVLENAGIELEQARSDQDVAPEAAESVGRWLCERGQVVVLFRRTAHSRIRVPDQIRPLRPHARADIRDIPRNRGVYRRPAAGGDDARELPAAQYGIGGPVPVRTERFVPPDRKLPNVIERQSMRPVQVGQSPVA